MTDRFKILLDQLNLSPSEFADRIGVQRSSISHVISGRNKPSIDFLEKILNVFPDIDATWLVTGRIKSQNDSKQAPETDINESTKPKHPGINSADNKKTLAPADQEPVDHIIIVYKNNTFRMLKPSEE
jgi:transcriptional regulator with XRE-family HTH domain